MKIASFKKSDFDCEVDKVLIEFDQVNINGIIWFDRLPSFCYQLGEGIHLTYKQYTDIYIYHDVDVKDDKMSVVWVYIKHGIDLIENEINFALDYASTSLPLCEKRVFNVQVYTY